MERGFLRLVDDLSGAETGDVALAWKVDANVRAKMTRRPGRWRRRMRPRHAVAPVFGGNFGDAA